MNKVIFTIIALTLTFSLFVVFSLGASVGFEQCDIVNGASGCNSADFGVVSLYDPDPGSFTEGHVYNYTPNTPPDLLKHLCCNYNGTNVSVTAGYCSHQPLFSLWDLTNSHIAQNSSAGAPYRVCATSYNGFTQCDYNPGNGACASNQTLIGTMDTTLPWNSHFGLATYLTTNICCTFNTSLMLQGINIGQFEYWCGVDDGVCPEDYRNTTGSRPLCYPREDPDC